MKTKTGTERSDKGELTIPPYFRNLNLWLRSNEGRKRHPLQLRFREESSRVVGARQLPGHGDVGMVRRPGPFATPVVGLISDDDAGGGLGLADTSGGDQDRSDGE